MKTSIVPDYKPDESEVVVQYEIHPRQGIAFHDCLQQLITKSNLEYKLRGEAVMPHIFDLNQELRQCKVAFDEKLFEAGNIPQNLSVIAGAIFDSNIPAALKVLDIKWPSRMHSILPGPSNELDDIRLATNIKNRPLSCVVLHPKVEISIKECLEKAYHIWMGGCDMVQESELMTSLKNNDFQERISFLSREKKACSERTKQKKIYIPNITANTIQEMKFRAKKVKESGLNYVVINAVQVGLVAISSIKQICQELNLTLCANLSGQGLYTRNQNFQISGNVLALIYRYLGIDQLEIKSEINDRSLDIANTLRERFHNRAETHLPTLPVCSNIDNIGQIEAIVKHFGHDIVIQGSICISNHPDGVKAGAEAFQFAIESAAQGIDKKTAAENNEHFKKALEI